MLEAAEEEGEELVVKAAGEEGEELGSQAAKAVLELLPPILLPPSLRC